MTLNSRFNIKFDKNHWQSFAPQRAFGLLPPNRIAQVFDEHYAELVAAHPEHEGKRDLAFQGWIIQKVAGLQLCVNELERRITDMKND